MSPAADNSREYPDQGWCLSADHPDGLGDDTRRHVEIEIDPWHPFPADHDGIGADKAPKTPDAFQSGEIGDKEARCGSIFEQVAAAHNACPPLRRCDDISNGTERACEIGLFCTPKLPPECANLTRPEQVFVAGSAHPRIVSAATKLCDQRSAA